jgi:hypothetical protein
MNLFNFSHFYITQVDIFERFPLTYRFGFILSKFSTISMTLYGVNS